ncbi:retinol dehydrogenase 8 [Triplophysa rosa]|uniref:retinol dehydrogenase 8 n=1 Tax=Triplophysa rosa TaxID=992332 RepID=UPI002545CAAC|nr:retinol dehydrogenase 8 [Triplophysa rosa]
MSIPAINQKVVLITGCSSGIGLALAARIAKDEKKRFLVYATMRNLTKGAALVEAAGRTLGRTLEIKQLDVCDETSIKACVDSLPVRRVDILISNAGLGLIGPIECQSIDEMKTVMDTNFFGLVRLLKEVLPDMKKRKSGHIVVMSSVMGIQGILFNDIYAASKFAVEGFCESLAVQALRFNLNISLIEPGPVITEFERKVYEECLKIDLSTADKVTADMFTNIYLKNYSQIFETLGQTPEDIAEIEKCPLQMRGQTTLLKEAQICFCGFHKVHPPVTVDASQSTHAQSTPSISDVSHSAKMAKLTLSMFEKSRFGGSHVAAAKPNLSTQRKTSQTLEDSSSAAASSPPSDPRPPPSPKPHRPVIQSSSSFFLPPAQRSQRIKETATPSTISEFAVVSSVVVFLPLILKNDS